MQLKKLALSSTDVSADSQPLTLEVFPVKNSDFYYAKLDLPKGLYTILSNKNDYVPTIVILD